MSNTTTLPASETFVRAEVAILWSENSMLNQHKCENVDEQDWTWHSTLKINREMGIQTHKVVARDGGYDKTKFQFRVHTADGETHVYQGRVDIGSDTENSVDVIEDHIMEHIKYMLGLPTNHVCGLKDPTARFEAKIWLLFAMESKRVNMEERAK